MLGVCRSLPKGQQTLTYMRYKSSIFTFPQEKIARSLIPHEHALAGSFYGKFFARKLNLHLLQRNIEAWKDFQSSAKPPVSTSLPSQPATSAPSAPATMETMETKDVVATGDEPKKEKRKRKAQPEDEIDALFEGALGKKVKKAGLEKTDEPDEHLMNSEKLINRKIRDKDLLDVMGAIRSAPKEEKRKKRAR